VVIGTRWHEDDFIGRLLSSDYDGDPDDWEVISFPAIAEEADVLGRAPGDPLLTPLIRDETPEQAIQRWAGIKRAVGSYAWASLFQQRPAPEAGAIFNAGWWRYWTLDPDKATDDGKVVYFDPDAAVGTRWLDSWDMAFKASDDSDYVVGQRWCRHGGNRYLVAQKRGRWSFTATMREMKDWTGPGQYGRHVHQRLVEDKANGPAIIDTLHDEIPGLKPINPRTSKEARARSITPEVESGNVYLPLPSEEPWVLDLLAELRSFPSGANDDMVDTLTQALTELRESGAAMITVPGDRQGIAPVLTSRFTASRTGIRRSPGG
jgi:predicted phage terminase large subunit-like protein